MPGLHEVCIEYPHFLLAYAPQLAIASFGGPFESEIEALYQRSLQESVRRRAANPTSGTALTEDGNPPRCDELVALRDPHFGGLDPALVACNFVQGDFHGPSVSFYESIDYLAWLLSTTSSWLPGPVKSYLTKGMAAWGIWPNDFGGRIIEDFGYEPSEDRGDFATAIRRARRRSTFRPSRRALRDLTHRLQFSADLLGLPESGSELTALIMDGEVLDHYFDDLARRQRR